MTNNKEYNPTEKQSFLTKSKDFVTRKQNSFSHSVSKKYAVFLIVSLVLFLVFLSSRLWLPTDKQPIFTKRGEVINITPTITAELMNWEYNPSTKYAEATLQIARRNVIIPAEFEIVGKADNGKIVNVKTGIAYYDNDIMVVRMENIPKDFIYLSITIFEMTSETKSTSETEMVQSDSAAKFREDFRNVTHNSSLVKLTSEEYLSESYERTIDYYEYKKDDYRKEIEQNIIEIAEINKQINNAESSDSYLTLEEKETLKSSIQSRKKDIENIEKRNIELAKNISDLNKKIETVRYKMSMK